MKPVSLPYVNSYCDRHGKLRHYFRRGRAKRVSLPGAPGSPEFLKAYDLARNGQPAPATRVVAGKGSIEALVREFYASGDFRTALKASTRREYRYRLEWLRKKHGTRPVSAMRRRDVLKMRDEKCETPGEANTLLRIVRRVLSFAVDREYRDDNPAAGIKLFKGGEFRDWSDEELAMFEARWAPGTTQRMAYSLLLYTGQRRQDVAAMTEHDLVGERIKVVQEKTGAKIDIPAHETLRAELDLRKRQFMLLVADVAVKGRSKERKQQAFTSEALGQFLADAIDEAKLPDDCVVHGLRKTAARKLAEAGCSEDEIMAVTGHRSAQMVRLYVKGASRVKMADSAVLKWKG
jgi:integrase